MERPRTETTELAVPARPARRGRLLRAAKTARALGLSALLALVAATAGAEIIFTTQEPAPAEPGSFATFSCRVEYDAKRGEPWKEVRIRFTPPADWPALASERTLSIGPGRSQTIPFTVRVPELSRPDRAHDGVFELFYPPDPDPASIAVRGIVVQRRYGLHIDPARTELTARAGERVELSLAVRNDGNTADEARFAFESVPDWRIDLDPPSMTLEPGASLPLLVSIEVPEGTQGGMLHILDLRAESVGAARAGSPVTAFARVHTEVLKARASESRYGRLPIATAFTAGEIAPGEQTYGVRVLAAGGIGSDADVSLEADLASGSRARGVGGWQSQTLRATVSRGGWELNAGDLGIPLSSLSAPSFSGRGVRLSKTGDAWKLHALAVRNREDERTASWSTGIERRIAGGLAIGGEVLERETGQGVDGTRLDRLQTMQAVWRGPHRLLMRGEFGVSQSEWDATTPASPSLLASKLSSTGRAAQLTLEKSGRTATVKSRFHAGSSGYGGRIGDRDGALLFASWAPGARWIRLWSSFEDQDGSAIGDSTRNELTRTRAGVRFEPRHWPGLEISGGDLDEREHLPDSTRATEQRDLVVTTKVARGSLLTVASVRHGIIRDLTSGAEGDTRALELSAGGRIRDARLALRWSHSEDWSEADRNTVESEGWTADVGYTTRTGKANVGLAVSERKIAAGSASGSGRSQFAVEPRLDLRVFHGWTLRVDASIDRFDEDTRVDRWQLSLHHSPMDLLPIPWVPLRGGIRGLVFVDRNGDGIPGLGEPRIENVLVRADGRYQPSDRHGEFSWPNLEPGTYWVEVDRGSIPPEYQLPANLPLEVTLEAGSDHDVWIALLPCGSVSGRAFLDVNRDGRLSERERGLADLRIALWRDGVAAIATMTDGTGQFHLPKVPAGAYELRIEPQWVPTGWTPTSSTAPVVDVLPGAHTELHPYGVAPRQKPIVITYQGK